MVLEYEFDEALKKILASLFHEFGKKTETQEDFVERNLYPIRRFLRNSDDYSRRGTGCWNKEPNLEDVKAFFN